MRQYIAILEDDAERIEHMKQILESDFSDHSVRFFSNALSMIDWVEQHLDDVALFSLDHDLIAEDLNAPDPGDGRDVANYLATKDAWCPVIIHSTNYYGRVGMKYALLDRGWTVEIISPEPEIEWIDNKWEKAVVKLLKN